jgi:hypothetical protein
MMGEPSIFQMKRRDEILVKNTVRFYLKLDRERRAAVVEASTIVAQAGLLKLQKSGQFPYELVRTKFLDITTSTQYNNIFFFNF